MNMTHLGVQVGLASGYAF